MIEVVAIERLKDNIRELRQVGDALGLLDAQEKLQATPAAFVIEQSETATAQRQTGRLRQNVTLNFSVVLIITKSGASRSTKVGMIGDLRTQIQTQLIGWDAPGTIDPVIYTGFQLVQLGSGLIAYQNNFQTRYRATK